MSLAFLSQKSFHPANKANQKRIWVAEQTARERDEREKEKAKEVRKARELQQAQQAAADAGDKVAARRVASQQVSFLYAAPPGLPETKEETKQTQREEDDAVREFRRKAERRGDQRKLERYVGRRAEETLTIKDQVERFPILKDAPVEGKYTESIRVNFQPVGLRLRNVRCIRCGEWGHQSGDRECKLRDQNPNDATRQRWEDPVTEIKKLKSAKQDLVLRRAALPLEMQEAGEEFEILQSDDDEAEDAYLASLSTKQQKRLMTKLKRESRGDSRSSDTDSDSYSYRHRARKRKHKSRRKHKHRSRGRSEDERETKKEHIHTSRRHDASLSPRQSKHNIISQRLRSRSKVRETKRMCSS